MKNKISDFVELTQDDLLNINGGREGNLLYYFAYGVSYVYHSTVNAIGAVADAFAYGMEAQANRIYPVI